MHPYRTHTCAELRPEHTGTKARLSGWVHVKRDHGNLLFVDLRDHHGLTQCVIDVESPLFKEVEGVRVESVVTLTGTVVERSAETVNPKHPTGEVELRIDGKVPHRAARRIGFKLQRAEISGSTLGWLAPMRGRVRRRMVPI